MARSLRRWTYEDITDFLTEKGFQYSMDVNGVSEAWMNFYENGEPDRIVEIKHTPTIYTPRTLKRMIRQSGIPQDEWLKW